MSLLFARSEEVILPLDQPLTNLYSFTFSLILFISRRISLSRSFSNICMHGFAPRSDLISY